MQLWHETYYCSISPLRFSGYAILNAKLVSSPAFIPFIMRCFFQYIVGVGLLPSMASLRALLSDDNLVEVFHFDVLDNDLTLERSENVVKGSQLPIKIEK